jgi:hypothetical protein
VVNLDFLTHTITSRVRTISEQMRRMGESIRLPRDGRRVSELRDRRPPQHCL